MRRVILAVMLVLVTLTGCTSETEYGDCLGVQETKDPTLVYKIPTVNIVVGLLFIETIFVPAVVLLSETHCPIGKVPSTTGN
jgi:hypothetical protein